MCTTMAEARTNNEKESEREREKERDSEKEYSEKYISQKLELNYNHQNYLYSINTSRTFQRL